MQSGQFTPLSRARDGKRLAKDWCLMAVVMVHTNGKVDSGALRKLAADQYMRGLCALMHAGRPEMEQNSSCLQVRPGGGGVGMAERIPRVARRSSPKRQSRTSKRRNQSFGTFLELHHAMNNTHAS